MQKAECDVLVIGCGSGGIGAAIGAAERGAKVIIIDKNQVPGGVVSMSWVHNWEPTCGNAPITRKLWSRMQSYSLGAAMMDFSISSRNEFGGKNPTMPFELWAYQRAVFAEFNQFENLKFINGMRLVSSRFDGRKIHSITCSNGNVELEISAKCYVDATGDIALARMAGCQYMLGQDSQCDFNEKPAPIVGCRSKLNEVNWLYRVRPGNRRKQIINLDAIPEVARIKNFFRAKMPNGDLTINICGQGNYNPEQEHYLEDVFSYQYNLALMSYYWLVGSGAYPDWELLGLAPEMGIRESYRLQARKIITFNDVIKREHKYAQNYVAMTDHPLDVHGTSLHLIGSIPFGVPYESLLPVEYDNLFIGGRGIGASHIASGGCRLSRTVMTYGNAAGKAAAVCALSRKMPEDIEPSTIADYEACPEYVYNLPLMATASMAMV